MSTRYQDQMDAERDALRPAWVKLGEAVLLGSLRERNRRMTMSDRSYTSVNPLTIEQLVTESDWYLIDEDDGLIEDGHGNEAWLLETDDGHLEMYVDDGTDVSDLLEAVPFHLNDDEADDDT